MLIYLDDLLFLMPGNSWAPRHASFIVELLSAFGLRINLTKSFLTPMSRFVHLGLVVDFRRRRFDVPPAKLLSIRS